MRRKSGIHGMILLLSAFLLQRADPGQIAFLRRMDHVIIATATDLTPAGFDRGRGRRGDTVDAKLVIAHRTDSIVHTVRVRRTENGPLLFFGAIDPVPSMARIVIGFETGVGPAWPTFALTPPQTLGGLRGVAISDPVLLTAPRGNAMPPPEPLAAMRGMSTSTAVDEKRRIGVYWETYGIDPADSLDIAVWIERFTPQSALRRLGISLRIATDYNTPVAMMWTEARAGRGAHVITGQVPVLSRTTVLDTSTLAKGEYRLEIAVARPGQAPVRSSRNFIVR